MSLSQGEYVLKMQGTPGTSTLKSFSIKLIIDEFNMSIFIHVLPYSAPCSLFTILFLRKIKTTAKMLLHINVIRMTFEFSSILRDGSDIQRILA